MYLSSSLYGVMNPSTLHVQYRQQHRQPVKAAALEQLLSETETLKQ